MRLLLTVGLIFAVLVMLVLVDHAYRRFAARHPESGPFRKRIFGCGDCKKAGPDGECNWH
jgi:hypothetical protein